MSDVVLVRDWAAAKAAAGRPEEEFPSEPTLAGSCHVVRARYGEGSPLDVVLGRCSYLVDEVSPGRARPPRCSSCRGGGRRAPALRRRQPRPPRNTARLRAVGAPVTGAVVLSSSS